MLDDVNDMIRRLEAIRQSVGGEKVEFVPRIEDRDLTTPEEVEDLFHRSGLLIYLQNPVFVYIRDHTVGTFVDTIDRRRIHFSVCTTLQKMKNQGRFERYRRTTRVDDVYLIDVKSGRNGEIEVPLYPCKHCLMKSTIHVIGVAIGGRIGRESWRNLEQEMRLRSCGRSLKRSMQRLKMFNPQAYIRDTRPTGLNVPTCSGSIENSPAISAECNSDMPNICSTCTILTATSGMIKIKTYVASVSSVTHVCILITLSQIATRISFLRLVANRVFRTPMGRINCFAITIYNCGDCRAWLWSFP